MGKFMRVKTSEIIPSQDYVKEGTVKFILQCILNDEKDKLPPTPVVRSVPDRKAYIAIDGHNLIAVFDMLGLEIEVFVCDSEDDRLLEVGLKDAIDDRNDDLKKKFDMVLPEVERLDKLGIMSFWDLRGKYEYLKSFDFSIDYFNLK